MNREQRFNCAENSNGVVAG